MSVRFRRFLMLVLFATGLLPALASAEQVLALGVFAYRPKEILEQRYRPLADYLSAALPGVRVELQLLDHDEMEKALDRHALDLLFTNPSHYLIVRSRNALTGALATQVSLESGLATSSLGGVIFTRAERRDISTLSDVRRRRVAIPGPKYLGGYQTQMYELQQVGVSLDDAQFVAVGSHDQAMQAVLDGKVDVGFVRTGIIEEWVRAGRLDPAQLRIINRQSLPHFPYIVSTRLYPEWPFLALPHVDARLTRKVAAALLALEADHPASRAAGIAGFAPPADYLPVENLARALRVPPFDQPVSFSAADAWQRYWPWLSGVGLLFAVILLLSVRLAVGNRRLASANAQIEAVAHALSLERQHLSTLVQTLPDLVWLKDCEGVYLDCNPRFEQFFGATKAEIVGRTDYDFVDRQLADFFRANDRLAMERGGLTVNEEWVTFASDGHHELLETTKCPMYDEQGKLIGVLGIGHDITERKELQTRLEQLNATLGQRVEARTRELLGMERRATAILQSSAAGLYGLDREGKIVFINEAACAMLGLRPEQAIGHSAHALFHSRHPDGRPYPADECPFHRALMRGEMFQSSGESYWRADGTLLPVMVWLHPAAHGDDEKLGAVVSFVDVSRQREADQAKDRALAAAEHLARVRSEFVANMSHEIRTPLNGILGFADIGLRNVDNPDKVWNALTKVRAAGRHLLGIINDILDFSKIEAGGMRIDTGCVALRATLHEAVEMVRDQAEAKGLVVTLQLADDVPEYCLGDSLRLRQVLLNLLSNSVKFTEQGSVGLVTAIAGDRLQLNVVDSGIGMTEAQLAGVFDPFVQADTSSTRRFGGTGLGLSITRRLVELMGGSIEVVSAPGKGSSFNISLPFVPAAPAAAQVVPVADGEQPLAGISVLVAEDNLINREVLVDNLMLFGARVVAVENGQEAWERVIDDGPESFDLVLMDIQMPVMGGYEATERILSLVPELPIIGQTAHAYGEERDRCFAVGMVAHIAKPIDFDALAALVRQHARRRRTT
jgi:PAS domain S-box-containing protein